MSNIDAQIARLKGRGYVWALDWVDVEALARIENCCTVAYLDISGTATIAWGETQDVHLGMVWTEEQCDARFYTEVAYYARSVIEMCKRPANRAQVGAFVRLAYNIGLGRLRTSTALAQHNAGNYAAASRAFLLFDQYTDHGVKRVSNGLAARRATEAARYLEMPPQAPPQEMPQEIADESSLAVSPIARAGAVTATAGAATGSVAIVETVSQWSELARTVRDFGSQVSDFVGLPPGAILAVVLIVAGWIVLHWRTEQRNQGRA